jgi:Kef-type K+ transport system membrane component KefB
VAAQLGHVRIATRGRIPQFRAKLAAVGYGFTVPVFFVASGVQLDLRDLVNDPSALVRLPLFLLALLVVRGTPAMLYRRAVAREQRSPPDCCR